MAFQISPGINFSEISLTTTVPGSVISTGAFAGYFPWGPMDEAVLSPNEVHLVNTYGIPDANSATAFFTVANFQSYGGAAWVVRTANTDLVYNASSGSNVLVKNRDDYNDQGGELTCTWAARYPGAKGNGLKVSVCPTATAFRAILANTGNVSASSTSVNVAGANVVSSVSNGDLIKVGTEGYIAVTNVQYVGNNTIITLATAATANQVNATVIRKWEFADKFLSAPGTSDYAAATSSSNDEIHVIVVDSKGRFSGSPGTVLEKYQFLSKASDAKYLDGTSQYYVNYINQRSEYIWFGGNEIAGANAAWGTIADGTEYEPTPIAKPETVTLSGGVDALASDGNRMLGYDKFVNPDEFDVGIILGGETSTTLASYLITNIAEVRRDCVAFISPLSTDVVFNRGNELDDVSTFRDVLTNSSYAFLDCNWKYQYDKYNDVNRWIPLNGDIGGLCARTDNERDPWFSPGGFTRGRIKNVIKLAWNPTHADRDELYKKGINPVVSFPNEGPILYGDKTLQTKPDAFDRINVRRLFIILEKSISKAAKYTMFEFNNSLTRSQFVAMVEPFLRTVQGRQGIIDYRVVCNETNNPGDVIDRHEFVGDIYIKPAQSINYIQLNFVAVRTAVSFDEIIGKF